MPNDLLQNTEKSPVFSDLELDPILKVDPRNAVWDLLLEWDLLLGLKTPGLFSGFFRRSFCTYRELQKPKSDQFHLAFSCFFFFYF